MERELIWELEAREMIIMLVKELWMRITSEFGKNDKKSRELRHLQQEKRIFEEHVPTFKKI